MFRFASSASAPPLVIALSLVMTATACDSDSNPGGSDFVDGMYRCSVETESFELEELDSAGFSAAEVLAQAAPLSVGWIEPVHGEPEAVEIRFTAHTGALRKQVRNAAGQWPCDPEALFADGTLRIVSEHRLLDESLAVTVEAVRDQGVGMNYLLDVRHGIAVSELGGSLTPTDFLDEPGFALTGLELSGSFKDGAFVGLLSAYAEKHTRQLSEGFQFDILTLSTEPVE